ncbi:MAG: bifunctional transaldolase/phosoglucose isomerase, partial [Desulfatibacillaceae bacterium]|nr:bifunctional transaldolase/phosoglucose isomerase [Desulfatibacillaceae bacterium]
LVVEDITHAADALLPVYRQTDGQDGFVSLEVSPKLADDAKGTVEEALHLWTAVDRPNLMIKVPATPAGVVALKTLIGLGVNVNATLLFSCDNYEQVANAYLEGLGDLAAKGPSAPKGHGVNRVASVASFFVSRIDSAVDRLLKQGDDPALLGRIAVANAKLAYERFTAIFAGPRWEALQKQGARVQRLLWASTSVKNPDYPDLLYVEPLMGPHTVNTLPPETLDAFLDHGKVGNTLGQDIEQARADIDALKTLEIDLPQVTDTLQKDGVEAFAASFDTLMQLIEQKSGALKCVISGYMENLGKYTEDVLAFRRTLMEKNILGRIWSHDHTVWKDSPKEISNRLGWLVSPKKMLPAVGEILAFVDAVRRDGINRVLLLGMGGSSLAPEVFAKIFGRKKGFCELKVLDSTDPGAVLEAARWAHPRSTLFIISTKSGGTVETLSFAKYFYNFARQSLGEQAGKNFAVITDPGSTLEQMAHQYGFRKAFLNDPDIGGRFSALSYFGLVPAALLGVDIKRLLKSAEAMSINTGPKNCPFHGDNTAARLGSSMGVLAASGRDKLTLVLSPSLAPLCAWIEQLVAESTGKQGVGILPVEETNLEVPQNYGPDRFFVHLALEGEDFDRPRIAALAKAGHPVTCLTLKDIHDVGGEFFRQQMAVAIACARLGVNPFDQPDVESAKVSARQMMADFLQEGRLPESPPLLEENGIVLYGDFPASSAKDAFDAFLAKARPGNPSSGAGRSYLCIQAYLKPSPGVDDWLGQAVKKLSQKTGLAVVAGYGPRFLHSTGQLHKGDAGRGLFLQITAKMAQDAVIPDEMGKSDGSLTFGVLKAAQALGDAQALKEAGRSILGIRLAGKDTMPALNQLAELFE